MRAARTIANAATAVAVVALGGAVVVGGLANPAPSAEPVPADQVEITATDLVLVCSDPPRLVTGAAGSDIDYDDEFATDAGALQSRTDVAVLARDGGSTPVARLGELHEADDVELTASGSAAFGAADPNTGVTVLRAAPADGVTALGAGVVTSRSEAGDLRGLAATSCAAPSSTQWIVGGRTDLGSSARLSLTNPGLTPVTASVDVWGGTGPVEGASGILVPPGETHSMLLEVLSQEERIAVRVNAEGGALSSTIQTSSLRGVVPAGTDIVSVAADPSTELTIGPLRIHEDENDAILRLVNPGTEVAEIDVRLLTADGQIGLAGAQGQGLEPGTVTDISLDGVDPGVIAVHVGADAAITGAVMRSVDGEAGELDPSQPVADLAWLAATTPQQLAVMPLSDELIDGRQVLLANPLAHPQQVQVQVIDAEGAVSAPEPVELPASGTGVLPVPDGSDAVALQISGEAVLATTVLRAQAPDGSLIAMYPATADGAAAAVVGVRVGAF